MFSRFLVIGGPNTRALGPRAHPLGGRGRRLAVAEEDERLLSGKRLPAHFGVAELTDGTPSDARAATQPDRLIPRPPPWPQRPGHRVPPSSCLKPFPAVGRPPAEAAAAVSAAIPTMSVLALQEYEFERQFNEDEAIRWMQENW